MKKLLAEIKSFFQSLTLWSGAREESIDGFTLLTARLPSGAFLVCAWMKERETGTVIPAAGAVLHANPDVARDLALRGAILCRTFSRLQGGVAPLYVCDECLWSGFEETKMCPMCLGYQIVPMERAEEA